jgi:selenocysteine lyase/cysteine desulfurase
MPNSMNPSSTNPWDDFRRQMPIAEKWAYFDHAAVAPLPQPTRDAIVQWVDQAATAGDTVWPSWSRRVEECRTLAARMIHADPAEVALVHSTSEGIGLVAEGYPWQSGDNVVTLDNEFPSNQYPWLNLASRGVETRRVAAEAGGRIDLNRLNDAIDERTRIVSVSWVGYVSGWRVNLDELSELVHRKGSLFFVDAIQGLGVFPLDVSKTPIDFLAADGHKWMLGPEGAGLFYLRREHLELLRPIGVGWHSVAHASDYNRIELNFKPTAARYEGGTQNMVGFLGLAASLELLLHHGQQSIGERIVQLTDILCERLQAAGAQLYTQRVADHCSGIVSCEFPSRDSLQLKQKLLQAGVVSSARGGKLRFATHCYNSEADIERIVEVVKSSE